MYINIFSIYVFKRFVKICYIIFFLLPFIAYSEGTKQVTPNSSNKTLVQLNNPTTNVPFAVWDCAPDYRLNIKICNNNTEKIYMGFQASGTNLNNVYWRLKNPNGLIVAGPTLIPTSAAAGYCATYAEAVAGPSQLGIAGGYNAFVYDPLLDGDYYIEFNVGTSFSSKVINLKFFDITVATGTNASGIKLGRLWSKDWEFQTQADSEPFLGIMYVYSTDGIVTKLNMNGMQPAGFHIACNSKGTINTGNYAVDRVSKIINQTYPEYKIFLNNPDITCYPSGTWGNLKGITIDGCAPNYCINVNIDKASPIGVIIDLNGQPGFQPNSADISIAKDNAVAGINCISWNGRDGLDSLVKSGTNINVQVDFFNGVTNLPLYDVEDNPNGFIVSLVRPAPPVAADTLPAIYWDDSQIIAGTAIDGKTNLTGCTLATGCHKWSGRGNNGCTPSCPETINTWWYANRQTKSVPFSTFYVEVDANASLNGKGSSNAATVCGTIAPIALNGSKTGASGIIWSSNGSGSFSPDVNTLNATYTPSLADINTGSVKLSIISTGNTNGTSVCPAQNDFFDITLQKPPTVNAGADAVYCANKPNISLNGSFGNGVTAINWSGGNGAYAPNSKNKIATYTPSSAEIKAGKVTLTIKSTAGNGVCPAASDIVVFSIDSVQRVKAGSNGSICANNQMISLTGSMFNGGTNPVWTGGTGTFGNPNSLITSYIPSAAEITAQTFTLTLTASKATCNNVSSNVIYTITPAPTVDAGIDIYACANNPQVNLDGSFTLATGVQWVGGTGTFNPNRTTKNAVYTPSAAEIAAKTVTLTLETTGNANCSKVSDQVVILIAPAPVASAGNDASICSNNPSLTLQGSVTGATGGIWTGGGGTFFPNNTTLNAQYTPTPAEIESGSSFLILTTTGNGTCTETNDTILVIVDPSPTVNAGNDTTICKNKLSLQLEGKTTDNTTQTWSTSGTGTFNNVNLTNAVYTPSVNDTLGTVTLTLKVNRAGCVQVSDQMLISFNTAPSVNAGANVSVCKNNPVANLNGFSSTGAGIWSGGTGTFTANEYTATAAEANTGSAITLNFTSTNNGNCNAVKSTMKVTFYNAPVVDAGIDQNICSNNILINLTGKSSTNAAVWSGGDGTFTPDTNSLINTYIPTNTEISDGSVTLSLASRNNAACISVADQVKITFTPSPIVNAGANVTICANNPDVILNGSVTNAGGGIWSNGGGSFNAPTTILANKYTPSSTEIQNGKANIKLTSTNNGTCNAVSDSIIITIDPAPIVDAGADQVVCGDAASVSLAGIVTNAIGGIWSKTGFATGTFSNVNSLSSTYSPSAADTDSGYVDLQLASATTGSCIAVKDIVRIYFTNVPTINAGPDQTVCANDFPVALNAVGSLGSWSGGTGTFSPSPNALNASYIPTANEISTGSLTLTYTTAAGSTCSSRSDIVIITLKPAPLPDAGTTTLSCSNSSGINLNGTVSNAGGGKWSTDGSGYFSPDVNTLNAKYVPSIADGNTASLQLLLTSTGNGQCSAVIDTLLLNLVPVPVVNAGGDQNVCNNNTIKLNGTVQNGNGLGSVWSGGTGTFNPDNTSPTAIYTPTANEISGGTLTLTLNSVSNGICPVISDQVIFTFVTSPTADAGNDQTVCETLIPVQLAATTTTATTGNWTSLGTGNFVQSNAGTNVGYVSSAQDIVNGSVNLIFATTDNKSCQPARDTVKISYTLAAIAKAGKDTSVCIDVTSIKLYGEASFAVSQRWRTSGTGTFDDNTKTDALYTPSVNDRNSGTVTLTLSARGNGTCGTARSSMVVRFLNQPIVFAGPNRNICEDLDSVSLIGKVTNAGGGKWTTSGTGTFKNSDSLQTYYYPSAADKSANAVTLTLTSTQNGLCDASSENFDLKFDTKPTINIGIDQAICADSLGISLAASLTNATGASWYTSGTGTFSPNANSLNVTYLPSLTNRNKRLVKIWASTTGGGSCSAVTDTMNLTLNPAPIVNAGNTIIVCVDKDSVQLAGSVINASGGKWYTSGTGTFIPNDTTLLAYYFPSQIDKANGNIVLTLRSTGNGLCKSGAAQVAMRFSKVPIADAGKNITYCNTVQSIPLNGIITYATGGQWNASGGGVILPDNSDLNATYSPTEAEISAGSAQLILNTTGNKNCNTQSDTVNFTFQIAPVITAGPNDTICADLNQVAVSATVSNSSDYVWSSLGSGTFNPGNTTLTTNYAPSASDISAQKVGLVISTINDGVCNAAKDTLYIIINPLPIISVKNDIQLCSDAGGVQLSASLSNAKGAKWNTSGSGSFSPSDSVSSPFYYLGADEGLENIAITAISTGQGSCQSKSDELILIFSPAAVINAGPDIAACKNAGAIQLNGTVSNTSGATWLTSGSGTFSPNATTLNATYTPSVADENSGEVNITLVGDQTVVCQSNSDEFTIKFSVLPVINAGRDSLYCTNSLPIQLSASGASGTWSGGAGIFSPNASALKGTYQPTAAEIASGSITLKVSTNSGLCPATSDDVVFQMKQGPAIDAGIDTTICVNTTGFNLYGMSNGNSSGIVWSTASGTGTFSPSATDINATFTPSAFQISNGRANITLTSTGNNGCPASVDKILVNLTPAPVVNAGFDITSCKDVSGINLKGSKIPASANTVWTTSSGLGTFTDPSDISTTFIPNATDVTNGLISLYLTATGSNVCKAIIDTMDITFSPVPTVFAGNDSTLCANTANQLLLSNSKVSFASGGVWTSTGAGTFSPNANTIKSTYIPATSEIDSGEITLMFTTTGNGACQPQSDPIVFTLQKPDTVNAGKDTTVCASQNALAVIGSSTTSNIKWSSTGAGTFTPDNTINTSYILSPSDIKNGGITITLTSTNVNTCVPAVDFATLIFNPAPISITNAGLDQTACISDTNVQLNGFIANATGGIWTTTGDGSFTPSDTTLEAQYIIGVNDKAQGSVNITLTSTGNGICNAVSDVMKLTLQALPTIIVSPKNTPACSDADSIILSASVTTATNALWKSTATGIFAPKADSLKTSFFPSESDISSGKLFLIAQSENNGACAAAYDTAVVTFGPKPTIDAGTDMHICRNTTAIKLRATATTATGGQWVSSGSGTISPNNLAATYNIVPADTSVNILIMKITSTGQGSCKPVSDEVTYTFDELPIVNAGEDVTVCQSATGVQLNGTAYLTTDYSWVSTGTGTFIPDNKSLHAKYLPSAADAQTSGVTLSLISRQVNTCTALVDQMRITFVKRPVLTIIAGPACYSFKGVNVSGTVANASGATWHTTGSGNFSPDNSKLNTQYIFGANDASKNITIYLVSNAAICASDTVSSAIFINLPPNVNAGVDKNVCQNDKITLTGNALPNAKYQWKQIGGVVLSTQSFVTVSAPNTKSYELQVTDVNKCVGRDTVKVNAIIPLRFNLAASRCLDPYTPINSKPAKYDKTGSFQWYKDGNILQGQVDTTLLVNSAGAYTIVYNLGQCASDSTIKVHPLPTMVNSGKVTCAGSKTTIKTSRLPAGSAYSWKAPLANINSNSNTVNAVKLGTSFYFVTGTDPNTCKKTDSIRVIGIAKPIINLKDTSYCSGTSFNLNAKPLNTSTYTGLDIRYEWFKNRISQNTDTNLYLVKELGLYKVIVSVEECSTSDSAQINVYPNPVNILPSDTIFCPANKNILRLDAGFGTVDQVSSPGTTYIWKSLHGDNIPVISKIKTADIKESGVYTVEIKNFYKCTSTDTIKVSDLCGPQIYVPTAFTPGKAGSGNDMFFFIQGKYFKNFSITIYSRWGEVVFTSNSNRIEESWNGTYLGQDMPQGTYPFKITFDALDSSIGTQRLEGSVTLLR